MDYATINDLQKISIKVGTIVECENVEGSEKLLKLIIDFGEEKRQILSGIAKWYTPEKLIGKQIPVIVNLEPRKMMGIESQGMILAADNEDGVVILNPEVQIPNGSQVH